MHGSRRRPIAPLGVLRAAGLAFVLFALATAGLIRSAQARLGEALTGLGRELSEWQPARLHGSPRTLAVNGMSLRLVSASSALRVSEVLDFFERRCRKRGGLTDVPKALDRVLPDIIHGIFRQEDPTQGVVACLDTAGPLGVEELGARLERLSETGDLDALGGLGYVLARQSAEGTNVLFIWTEGSVRILDAFGSGGDVPGTDPEGVPRPPGARRVLSAREVGQPYSVTTYVHHDPPLRALDDWYAEVLADDGWTLQRHGRGLIAQRRERALLVTVHASTDAEDSVVTLAEL